MNRELAEQHRQLLQDSAISADVAAERGYWTATRKAELETLGFSRIQRSVPALVIPIRDATGQIVNYQIRPDQPRIGENGKPIKYESPAQISPTLDVPTRCRDQLRSPHTPLWVTEGARKADAAATAELCCVSLPGVWSWAKRLNGDARQVLPDLQRVRFEDRKVIVAFDSDAMVKPQVYEALEALNTYLASQGALVSFCYLPELEPGVKCGLDDFLASHPVEDLWKHAEDELREPPEQTEERQPPLPTATLLGAVERLLCRYVRFPDEHGPVALALFALHTWAIDAADATPYVYIKSPQMRSGKTRVLEVLELTCREPRLAGGITEAALFQTVEAFKPTLLIDEVDAIFTQKNDRAEALRGVLNAGNRRGSMVIRGTQEGEPREFAVFCPKVLAGIETGKLPDTIRDRSIVLGLERKKRSESVERLRRRDIADQVAGLRGRLEDWAAADAEPLVSYRCEPLPAISDRLEDAWEPLLAIAELAGEPWPEKSRAAALALANGAEDAGEDHGQLLLAALRDSFGEREVMFTADICSALNEDDELPFGAYRRGEGIDGRGLGRLLKPYGIKPDTVRIGGEKAKGYKRERFAEAWERYVPAREDTEEPWQAWQRGMSPEDGSTEPKTGATDSKPVSVAHPWQPDPALQSQNGDGCHGATDATDEVQPPARAHIPEGRTARGLELEERALAGADDETSCFIRGETNVLGESGEWTEEGAADFITRAVDVFGGGELVENAGGTRSGPVVKDPLPPIPFDMNAWLRRHPEVANLGRCQGIKTDGERCSSTRRPGSPYCGMHGKGRP